MPVAVHVTHEAVKKLGGIGTVLHGLITSKKYQKAYPRTLLYTPLFHRDGDISERLGEDSEVLYSGVDGYDAGNWQKVFSAVESSFGVKIVYGKKEYKNETDRKAAKVDIVAVDIWQMDKRCVDGFKFKLWEHFGIQSDRYAHDSDYEQYLRIGAAAIDVIEALYGCAENAIVFSHEYMGMASALRFAIDKRDGRRRGDKTVFYAHEVSTARQVVERHAGHDFAFYNILRRDLDAGISLEQEFGSYSHYSRNELVKRAVYLDHIFAVSDITKEEYLYLCPGADEERIKVVYNGIPIEDVSYGDKAAGTELVGDYCERLFNYRPDYIFTHVARLVVSKAMWRDVRLLYYLDEHLVKTGKKAFFILLSTLIADGRPSEDVYKMEADYGWPVVHHEGWPDIVGQEVDIYRYMELFNARSKALKGVFINQFGFSRRTCGERVPAKASMLDIRLASDMEFGFSIYEPFGIAQIETIPYGGVPVLSSVCGCASVVKNSLDHRDFVILDFTSVPATFREMFRSKPDFLNVTKEMRDLIETEVCKESAGYLLRMLGRSEAEKKERFKRMRGCCAKLGWDNVAERMNNCLSSAKS